MGFTCAALTATVTTIYSCKVTGSVLGRNGFATALDGCWHIFGLGDFVNETLLVFQASYIHAGFQKPGKPDVVEIETRPFFSEVLITFC